MAVGRHLAGLLPNAKLFEFRRKALQRSEPGGAEFVP